MEIALSGPNQPTVLMLQSRPENLKNSRPKKLVKSNKSNKIFREIAFLSVFPIPKIDFWPFLKLQKMEFGEKIVS